MVPLKCAQLTLRKKVQGPEWWASVGVDSRDRVMRNLEAMCRLRADACAAGDDELEELGELVRAEERSLVRGKEGVQYAGAPQHEEQKERLSEELHLDGLFAPE